MAFTPMTPVTIQPHYVASLKLSPDVVQPLCGITENILGVSVQSSSPYKTIQELIAAAKTKSLSYGSPGPNSAPFLAIDQLERDQNIKLNHVPYKGDAGSIQELMAGRLDFVSSIAASAAAQIRAGNLRLLAVTSANRHPEFPEVPTFKELGINVQEDSFAGLFLPKGVPADIVAKLDAACEKATQSEAVKRVAASGNQVVNYQNRATWESRIASEFKNKAKPRSAMAQTCNKPNLRSCMTDIASLPPIRRVVTANDEQGRSYFCEDGPSPAIKYVAERPGYRITNLWRTEGSPAEVSAPDSINAHTGVEPPAGGTVLRILDIPRACRSVRTGKSVERNLL